MTEYSNNNNGIINIKDIIEHNINKKKVITMSGDDF